MPKDQHPSEDKSSPPLNQNDSSPDQRNQQNTVHPQHSPAETTEAQPTIEANTAPALNAQNEPDEGSTTATEPPSSKLIVTKKSTLWWMLLVLLLGISIIMWAWRIGPFNTPI